MSRYRFLPLIAGLLLLPALYAQVSEPNTYTITEVNGMMGKPVTEVVYRNGFNAVIDLMNEPGEPVGAKPHLRTFYDLKAQTSFTWDPKATVPECGDSKWSGDWGDPYSFSDEILKDAASGKAKAVGTETVLGLPAKVYEENSPRQKIKAWLDAKTGLILRLQMTPPSGPAVSMLEVRKVSAAPPSDAVFVLPASCATLRAQKPAPTEAELVAAETGESAANFVNANHGPGSKTSCTVYVRVMRPASSQSETMQPITSKLQIALDTTYDVDHPPSYVFGLGTDGTETFSGGGLKEMTSQLRNGVLRIDNPPPYFNLMVHLVGSKGDGGGLIYRQCYAPQSVLLYVLPSSDRPTAGGDSLWAKGGEYSTLSSVH